MRTWNVRLIGFSILHILGTLAIPVLLFLLTSCTDREEEKFDDGPAFSAQQVGFAFADAAGAQTLANSKKGDWSLVETTQRIFTSEAEPSGLMSKQILEMTASANLYDLQILKSVYDIRVSPPVVSNQSIENCQVLLDGSEHSCAFSPMLTSMISSMATGPDLSQHNYSRTNSNNEIQARDGGTSTYHNLSTTHSTRPPPAYVKAKENCGGVPGCTLNITTVEFDEIRIENGERTRFHHEFDFSKEVPFLSIIQRHCIKWNYKIEEENRFLPARLCDVVVNFEYGT